VEARIRSVAKKNVNTDAIMYIPAPVTGIPLCFLLVVITKSEALKVTLTIVLDFIALSRTLIMLRTGWLANKKGQGSIKGKGD
jgi:hypothetical protein